MWEHCSKRGEVPHGQTLLRQHRDIHLNFLPSLATCASDASSFTIGSTVSIAEVTSQLEQAETAAFQENAEHIKRVASVQNRSVAS